MFKIVVIFMLLTSSVYAQELQPIRTVSITESFNINLKENIISRDTEFPIADLTSETYTSLEYVPYLEYKSTEYSSRNIIKFIKLVHQLGTMPVPTPTTVVREVYDKSYCNVLLASTKTVSARKTSNDYTTYIDGKVYGMDVSSTTSIFGEVTKAQQRKFDENSKFNKKYEHHNEIAMANKQLLIALVRNKTCKLADGRVGAMFGTDNDKFLSEIGVHE